MIRVLIADDSDDLALVLAAVLDAEPGLACAGRVDTAAGVADAAVRTGADVVLLDLRLPGGGGMAAIAPLRAAAPHTGIVVHSGFTEPELVAEAERQGADAFLPKGCDIEELFAVVKRVGGAPRGG